MHAYLSRLSLVVVLLVAAAVAAWAASVAACSAAPAGAINLAYVPLAQGGWFDMDGGSPERVMLWEGDEPPVAEEAPYLDFVTLVRVHRAIPRGYQFLHGPAIVRFRDTLFTSWANSLVDENSPSETMQGRRSRDGGLTWSAAEMIGPGFEGPERHSHGVFLVHEDKLWAFAARFGAGDEQAVSFPGLCMEAFVLNETADHWESRGVVAQDFWPMTEPKRLANGTWLLPGADRRFRAAVAISTGDDLTSWETAKIPLAEGQHCSEATAWVSEDEIVAIMRNESPADPALRCAAVSRSTDFGRSWSVARESNFPMLSAKAAAGVLSTGQRYLVSNSGLRNNARWPLTLAVGRPGAKTLCRLWRIRDGPTIEPLLPGRAKDRGWQYPYAYEDESRLYVVYSVGKEDCELAIIPVSALALPEK